MDYFYVLIASEDVVQAWGVALTLSLTSEVEEMSLSILEIEENFKTCISSQDLAEKSQEKTLDQRVLTFKAMR